MSSICGGGSVHEINGAIKLGSDSTAHRILLHNERRQRSAVIFSLKSMFETDSSSDGPTATNLRPHRSPANRRNSLVGPHMDARHAAPSSTLDSEQSSPCESAWQRSSAPWLRMLLQNKRRSWSSRRFRVNSPGSLEGRRKRERSTYCSSRAVRMGSARRRIPRVIQRYAR